MTVLKALSEENPNSLEAGMLYTHFSIMSSKTCNKSIGTQMKEKKGDQYSKISLLERS